MTEYHERQDKFEWLRQQAEQLLQQQSQHALEASSDIPGLIHELKVAHIELEIQNEELKRAQQELSDLHQEYADLYEFAPCGYLTLNSKGIITRANLTAVSLLGTSRSILLRSSLISFISSDWVSVYQNA